MNTPVNFETAKLLKEKGFNEKSFGRYYTLNGKDWKLVESSEYFRLDDEISIGGKFTLLAPTIAEVVMWLYEKHGIWISVIPNEPYTDDDWCFTLFKDLQKCGALEGYNSPTEAYEQAILYTLNNLI